MDNREWLAVLAEENVVAELPTVVARRGFVEYACLLYGAGLGGDEEFLDNQRWVSDIPTCGREALVDD